MKSFVSDVFSVGISKFIIIFLSLATSIIVARYLGPEKSGIIASLLVYPSLFMSIGSLGIRQSTAYFLGKKMYNEDDIKTAITQIWAFSSILSLIVCFVLMYFFGNSPDNFFMILFALVPIPFSLFNTYNSGIFLGKNEIGFFNKINWIPSLITLLLTILLVVVLPFEINGYLIAMIGGPFFIFFILLFKNRFISAFSLKVNKGIVKKMLGLGLVYAFSLLIINLNYKIDIILLDKLSNQFETGIYSKGSSIVQYLWEIPMLLSTIVFARSAVSKNNKDFSIKVTQLLRVSLIVITLGSLSLFIFSDILIIGLFGNQFNQSISVQNILIPGVILLTVFKVMNMDLAGKGKPFVALKAMIPALIINVILNFMLIPNQGADGAAWASTVSYSVATFLFLIFYSRECDIPIKDIFYFQMSDFDFIYQKMKLKKNVL